MAVRIELVPTLGLCIEGTARQEYSNSADEYMQRGQKDRKLEEKIELLRMFLETADFCRLRAESERLLVEGRSVRFILTGGERQPRIRNEMRGDEAEVYLITSTPTKGRNTSGTTTLPSACW